ncbi:MAG TPA: DMT family transporter, partial [Chloroflexota bacterium]
GRELKLNQASAGYMMAVRSRLPELGLISVVLVWASTFVVTKQIFDEISPLAFAFVRFLGITVLAFVVLALAVRRGTAQWRICTRDLPRFAAVGVCGYTLYQLGFVLGLERTSPFSSALLISTMPLFTIVLLRLLGEHPPLRAWVGVAIALIGTAVFEGDKLGDETGSLIGDLLSLGSAVSFATYGVINRPLVKRYPTATYTAYTVLAGAIPLLAISLPAALNQNWAKVQPESWLAIWYMIVFPVYIAYMVWNWAIARRGAAAASSFGLLVPIASGVLSALTYGEAFGVLKLAGAALILAGLVALQSNRRSNRGKG